jgi:DNA-binding transcriptional LysR family regulator
VLNLHHLRLFKSVVEHGGFTRAAAALNLSQPAISKSLKELEDGLQLTLIDRSARSVRLTEAGRLLYERARELFGVEQVAERELRELRGLKRGLLRIGASTTIATYFLPPVLGRFHLRHPRVRIRAASANTRTILRLLLESKIDVALVEGPVSHPRVDVVPWREDELVVIAHPEDRFARRASVAVQELAERQFLVREPGSGTRDVSEAALARHGVRLRNIMRVGGTEVMKQAVAAGLGLAVVSRAAAADQIALGRLAVVRVEELELRRTLTLLRLRDRVVPSAAAREMELLLSESDDVGVGDASGVA